MLHHAAVAVAIVGLCAAVSATEVREPLPNGAIPAGFGVNIHFTGDRPQLDDIAAAGFRFIRMDMIWQAVEKQKGVYDFAKTGYDALSDGCARRGIRPIYILDYGNPLYERERAVSTEAARKAYADYAEAAARHFAGHGFLWEIWNEPNIRIFWKPKPNVDDYMAMLKAAAPRIKAADPSGTLIAPASSTIDMKWLEGCFKRGMLDYVDAVSVHPYRGDRAPETVVKEYAALRKLIAEYAPKGKQVPILSGEWGYSSMHWFPVERQAAFLTRMYLTNLSQGIPVTIWYDWSNDGTNPNDNESNFGTVTHDLKPKPAYIAAQTLTRTLAGYKFEKRLDLASQDDYALLLTKGGERAVAFWTTGKDHEARVPLAPGQGRLVKMLGEAAPISWTEGGPSVALSGQPAYIVVGK